MIPVTRTFLPPLEDYQALLRVVWEKQWLTNRGQMVLDLEQKVKASLGSTDLVITNNGTVPLQIALKLLGNKGEVITTPFSYVATVSSVIWENCTPVFVDIDPEYLTIDEAGIEDAITTRTTAILATHVFGNPCHTQAIEAIAARHGLKVIYDAAHCYGVNYLGQSVFNYGDVSTCSFHATKIFHCGEGGAMFCKDPQLFHKLYYSHNFGHNGPLDFHGLGINGKISELQAAMGLSVLPYIPHILSERKKIVEQYNSRLGNSSLQMLKIRSNTEWNYSYYPVILETEVQLTRCLEALNAKEIFPRRYFYPSLNTINYIHGSTMPVSESVASRIICLPLYVGLTEGEVDQIANSILENL